MEFNGTRTVHIGNLSKLKRPKIGCMKPGKLNVTVWNEKGYLKELQDNKSYGCEVTLSKELSFSRYVLGNISIDEKTYSSGYDSTVLDKNSRITDETAHFFA